MLTGRMLKDIPIIGCGLKWPMLLVAVLLLLFGSQSQANKLAEELESTVPVGERPVPLSEYHLRQTIRKLNNGLRQLKRDFTQQITGIYFQLKSNPDVGVEIAKSDESIASIGASFIGEQFADILIKQHTIQRRALAGLKVAFVKLLPLETLQRLLQLRLPAFFWLKDASQVDLRPSFEGASEEQFNNLYSLIEMRTRFRALDDVVTLTSDIIRRILTITEWFLMENNGELDEEEKAALAYYSTRILDFYQADVIEKRDEAEQAYLTQLNATKELTSYIDGGEIAFVNFLDRVIDDEALDIDLNQEASELELPPTINEDIIENVRNSWIPKQVLDNVFQDRSILVRHKSSLAPMIQASPERQELDLTLWAKNAVEFIRRTYKV